MDKAKQPPKMATTEEMNVMHGEHAYTKTERILISKMPKKLQNLVTIVLDEHKWDIEQGICDLTIAYYHGKTVYDGLNNKGNGKWNGEARQYYIHELGYAISWDALMQVWDKLRNDINNSLYNEYGKCLDKKFETTVFEELKDNILHVDIKEAHRLIYEAITWLNQNKGK